MSVAGRRRFLLAGAAALLGGPARSQNRQVPRIGVVFNTSLARSIEGEAPAEPVMREFLLGLREFGYVDGTTIVIERRSAEGDLDRLESLIRHLVATPVDVIVVSGNAATVAAGKVTTSVPVVSVGMFRPMELGLVESLAHPGRNITGSAPAFGQELGVKRLELLHELVPNARRIAYFGTRVDPTEEIPRDVRAAAKSMALEMAYVDARLPRIDAGLEQVARERVDALLAAPTTPLYAHRQRIVAFAAKAGLPDIHGFREAVEAGGLASYGIDSYAAWRRAARYVHQILGGARPGELPVEQSDRYWLVLNERRARALGIPIPRTLRHRADEILE